MNAKRNSLEGEKLIISLDAARTNSKSFIERVYSELPDHVAPTRPQLALVILHRYIL